MTHHADRQRDAQDAPDCDVAFTTSAEVYQWLHPKQSRFAAVWFGGGLMRTDVSPGQGVSMDSEFRVASRALFGLYVCDSLHGNSVLRSTRDLTTRLAQLPDDTRRGRIEIRRHESCGNHFAKAVTSRYLGEQEPVELRLRLSMMWSVRPVHGCNVRTETTPIAPSRE